MTGPNGQASTVSVDYDAFGRPLKADAPGGRAAVPDDGIQLPRHSPAVLDRSQTAHKGRAVRRSAPFLQRVGATHPDAEPGWRRRMVVNRSYNRTASW